MESVKRRSKKVIQDNQRRCRKLMLLREEEESWELGLRRCFSEGNSEWEVTLR